MAPKLLKKQVNSDYKKETFFNKEVKFWQDTLARVSCPNCAQLARLVQKGRIDITNLDAMKDDDIKKVSKALKLKSISKKSNANKLEEIKAVAKLYVAGQGK